MSKYKNETKEELHVLLLQTSIGFDFSMKPNGIPHNFLCDEFLYWIQQKKSFRYTNDGKATYQDFMALVDRMRDVLEAEKEAAKEKADDLRTLERLKMHGRDKPPDSPIIPPDSFFEGIRKRKIESLDRGEKDLPNLIMRLTRISIANPDAQIVNIWPGDNGDEYGIDEPCTIIDLGMETLQEAKDRHMKDINKEYERDLAAHLYYLELKEKYKNV